MIMNMIGPILRCEIGNAAQSKIGEINTEIESINNNMQSMNDNLNEQKAKSDSNYLFLLDKINDNRDSCDLSMDYIKSNIRELNTLYNRAIVHSKILFGVDIAFLTFLILHCFNII